MTTTDAKDDLAYIRGVMHQTQRFTIMSGDHFILWGVLIGTGLLCNWWLAGSTHENWLGPVWLVISLGGGFVSFWLGRREYRRAPVASWAGRLIGNVWLACGMGYVLLLLLGIAGGVVPAYASAGIAAAITGIGVYLTGVLANLGWFRNTAWLWWLAGAAMIVKPGAYTLPLFVGLLLLLYVVPGIILSRQYRRSLRGDAA